MRWTLQKRSQKLIPKIDASQFPVALETTKSDPKKAKIGVVYYTTQLEDLGGTKL